MLQIQNLTITHKKDLRELVRDFFILPESGRPGGADRRGRKRKVHTAEADL